MTEPKKRNSTSLMLLLLYALLIASLLVLTLAGARLYSDTMDARDAHAKQRSALSYIQSQTAACGGKGNIRLIDGDHDIDCKIDGIGAMQLKSEFVKKV